MIRKILKHTNDRFRNTPCVEVTKFNDKLIKQVQDMKATMKASNGVGLSANQIGIYKKVCIMQAIQVTPAYESSNVVVRNPRPLSVFVNPKVVAHSETLMDSEERCLSVPRKAGIVQRYEQVTVEYQDLEGNKRKVVLYGEEARIIQHEIDHVTNILFIDKAVRVWKE
jgi:peptide deformylase